MFLKALSYLLAAILMIAMVAPAFACDVQTPQDRREEALDRWARNNAKRSQNLDKKAELLEEWEQGLKQQQPASVIPAPEVVVIEGPRDYWFVDPFYCLPVAVYGFHGQAPSDWMLMTSGMFAGAFIAQAVMGPGNSVKSVNVTNNNITNIDRRRISQTINQSITNNVNAGKGSAVSIANSQSGALTAQQSGKQPRVSPQVKATPSPRSVVAPKQVVPQTRVAPMQRVRPQTLAPAQMRPQQMRPMVRQMPAAAPAFRGRR